MLSKRGRMWQYGAALALASGCLPDVEDPALEAVSPPWGWNGETTDVVLVGDDFFPQVTASGSEAFEVDRQFRAWVALDGKEFELDSVTFNDLDHLGARVPSGLEPGRYDVGVASPNGGATVLTNGFTVTDTRADHLALEADELSRPVHAYASIGIRLLDPAGGPVPDSLAIAVTVTGAEDPSSIRFDATLDDQRWDSSLPGLRGNLGPGGTGFIAMTSDSPTDVWVTIGPEAPDSVVTGASQFLSYTAGPVASVDISVPDDDFVTGAGEPFALRVTLRDADGNLTNGVIGTLHLFERCGHPDTRLDRIVVLADETIVEDAVLTGATGQDGCDLNRIDAVGQAASVAVAGASRGIVVLPGDANHLTVERWPGMVVAGGAPLDVRLEARDAWGNRVDDFADDVVLTDTEDGLGETSGAWSCRSFDEGAASCDAWPQHASATVNVLARTSSGVEGESDDFAVLAGDPQELTASTATTTVAAGDLFDLSLRAADAFDNPVRLNMTGVDTPSFTDGTGSVSCAWTTTEGADFTGRFACAANVSQAAKQVEVTVGSWALTATSNPFEVTNTDLHEVIFGLSGVTTLTAGDPLEVSLEAFDVWGNPYILQAVSSVDLDDESGEVAGQVAALDADGTASLTLRPTAAWAGNTLSAYDGASLLGTSAAFDVTAGSASGLTVDVDHTWTALGDDTPVTVAAIDAYGNPVPAYAGVVTLSSAANAGDAVTVSGFSGGLSSPTFIWSDVALQDTLEATDGSFAGVSDPIDAVTTCTHGPSAALTLDGADELVLCRTGGSTPSTLISMAASTAGSASLAAFHFAPDDDGWVRSTASTATWAWTEEGAEVVQGLVVDASGCASSASAIVWVADSDGEPAGPVEVTIATTSLVAGSTTLGTSNVQLAGTDCAGDPASGGTLFARADLGALSSGTSTLSVTGGGLAVTLDAAGEAGLTWSMVSTPWDGSAYVHAGVNSGGAHGAGSASVSGEFAPPTVLDVSPYGSTSALFDTVTVTFSEPMLASSLNASTVAVTDPTGAAVSGLGFTVSAGGDTLEIELPVTQNAASGQWTLGIGSGARDAAGNRLDGAYSGSSSAFILDFGDVSDTAPDATSCVPASATVRPDGDDGGGTESDSFEVAVTAMAAPVWWEIIVTDLGGDVVRLDRIAASSATTTLYWDGRDQDGFVVDNGTHTVTISALDAAWNAGASCEVLAIIANRVTEPGGYP